MKKHLWIGLLLSLICTGLGMFYIGTPLMIIGGVILMAMQGLAIYAYFLTLGFFGMILLPGLITVHVVGIIVTLIYFIRRSPRDPDLAARRQRRFASPGKLILRTMLGLLIFAGSVYAGYAAGIGPFSEWGGEKRAVAEAAESHLLSKYGEDFEVSEMKYTWSIGTYFLKVHPKQNPELQFLVESNDKNPPVISNDDYLNRLWGFQLKEKVTPIAQELYPDVFLNAWVNVGDNETMEKDYDKLDGKDAPMVYDQGINMIVFADLTADGLSAERERVLNLIRQLPEVMHMSHTALQINYYPSEMNTSRNVNNIKKDFDSFGQDSERQTHILRVENLFEIDSADQIEIREIVRK